MHKRPIYDSAAYNLRRDEIKKQTHTAYDRQIFIVLKPSYRHQDYFHSHESRLDSICQFQIQIDKHYYMGK